MSFIDGYINSILYGGEKVKTSVQNDGLNPNIFYTERDKFLLEKRKVEALEKIAECLEIFRLKGDNHD